MTILEQYLMKICFWVEVAVTGCCLLVGTLFSLMLKSLHLVRNLQGSTIVITNPHTQLTQELINQLQINHQCNIINVLHKITPKTEPPLEQRGFNKGNKFYECNLTDFAEVKFLVKKIISDYGRIDIVINNDLYTHTCYTNDESADGISEFINQTSYGVLTFLQLLVNFVPRFLEQGGGCLISLKSGANSDAFLATHPEIRSLLRTFTQNESQMETIDMSTIVCYPNSGGWLTKAFGKYFPVTDKFIANRIIKGIASKESIVKIRFHLNFVELFCSFIMLHYNYLLELSHKIKIL